MSKLITNTPRKTVTRVAVALAFMTTTSLTGCSDAQTTPTSTVPVDRSYDQRFENNCQMKSTDFCQKTGQVLSKRDKWLPMVAHGGDDSLYSSARRVAMCLNNSGIRAYIVHAPDNDGTPKSMHVDYYTQGSTKYGVTAWNNSKNTVSGNDSALIQQAITAFEYHYGTVDVKQEQLEDCLKNFRDNSPKH